MLQPVLFMNLIEFGREVGIFWSPLAIKNLLNMYLVQTFFGYTNLMLVAWQSGKERS